MTTREDSGVRVACSACETHGPERFIRFSSRASLAESFDITKGEKRLRVMSAWIEAAFTSEKTVKWVLGITSRYGTHSASAASLRLPQSPEPALPSLHGLPKHG